VTPQAGSFTYDSGVKWVLEGIAPHDSVFLQQQPKKLPKWVLNGLASQKLQIVLK
jgi:hypothetical protein